MSAKKVSRRSSTSDSDSSTSSSSDSESESSDNKTSPKEGGKTEKAAGKGKERPNRPVSPATSDEENVGTKRRKLSGCESGRRASLSLDDVDSEDFSPLKKLGKFSGGDVPGAVSKQGTGASHSVNVKRFPEISKGEVPPCATLIKVEKGVKLENPAFPEELAGKVSGSGTTTLPVVEKDSYARSNSGSVRDTAVSKLEKEIQPVVMSGKSVAGASSEEFKKSKCVDRSTRGRCRSSSSERNEHERRRSVKEEKKGSVSYGNSKRRRGRSTSESGSSSSDDSRSSPRHSRRSSGRLAPFKPLSESTPSKKGSSQEKVLGQGSLNREGITASKDEVSSSILLTKSGQKELKSRGESVTRKRKSRSPIESSDSSSSDEKESSKKGNKHGRSTSRPGEDISDRRSSSRVDVKTTEHKSQRRSVERKYNKPDRRSLSGERNHRSSGRSDSPDRRSKQQRRRSVSTDKYRNQGKVRERRRRSSTRSRSPRPREMKSTNKSGRYADTHYHSRRSNSRSRESYHHRDRVLKSSHARSRSPRGPISSAYHHSSSSHHKSSSQGTARRHTSKSPDRDRYSNHVQRREGNVDGSNNRYGNSITGNKSPESKSSRYDAGSNQSSRIAKEPMSPSISTRKSIYDPCINKDKTTKAVSANSPAKKYSSSDSVGSHNKGKLQNSKSKMEKGDTDSSSSDSDSSSTSDVPKKKKKYQERKSSKKSKKKKRKKSKKAESRKLKKKSHHKDKKKSLITTPKSGKSLAQDETDNTIGPDPIKLVDESKKYAPKSQSEWEKEQSVIRKVVDEQTGRVRLIKGSGEIIESIVSKQQHKNINKAATQEDGFQFQVQLKSQFK